MVELQSLTSVVGYKARGRAPALFIVKLGTPQFHIIHQIQHMTKAIHATSDTGTYMSYHNILDKSDRSKLKTHGIGDNDRNNLYYYIELRVGFSYQNWVYRSGG